MSKTTITITHINFPRVTLAEISFDYVDSNAKKVSDAIFDELEKDREYMEGCIRRLDYKGFFNSLRDITTRIYNNPDCKDANVQWNIIDQFPEVYEIYLKRTHYYKVLVSHKSREEAEEMIQKQIDNKSMYSFITSVGTKPQEVCRDEFELLPGISNIDNLRVYRSKMDNEE